MSSIDHLNVSTHSWKVLYREIKVYALATLYSFARIYWRPVPREREKRNLFSFDRFDDDDI